MLKRKLAILMSGLLVVACSTQNLNVENKGFSTKGSIVPNPDVYPSIDPKDLKNSTNEYIPVIDKEITINNDLIIEEEKEIDFSPPQKDYITADTNIINVIYKNIYKIRTKNNKNISSGNHKDITLINSILKKYGILSSSDLSENEKEDNESNLIEKRNNLSFKKSEVPNRQSIHRYQFQKGTNFHDLLKELRSVSIVRYAYPELQTGENLSATLLARTSTSGNITLLSKYTNK